MESKDIDIIRRNYESLVQDSMSVDHITRILVNNGVLSSTVVEENKTRSSLDRKRTLFRDILKCGKNAFRELVLALRETNQAKLANMLDPNQKYQSSKMPPNRKVFSEGVLDINVTRSEKFCDDFESEVPTYKCRSKNRGAILIANNYSFDLFDLDDRQGSQYDVENLERLFRQFNFRIELVVDRGGEDMEKAIKEFFKNISQCDCLFLVIMSHGGLDSRGTYVYGTDGYRLYTEAIEHYATNAMSSHLHGVPKVILYNICRGNKADVGTRVPIGKTATESAGTLKVHSISDLLIGNATLIDYVAHRDFMKGAWYISSIVKVLEEYAHKYHIEDILKIVWKRVAIHRSDRMSMQTATYTNIGFQQLYLNPGIYEERGELRKFDNAVAEVDNDQTQNGNNDNACGTSANAENALKNEDLGDSTYVISGDTVEN